MPSKELSRAEGSNPRRPRGRTAGSSNLALCWFLLLRPSLELVLLSAYRAWQMGIFQGLPRVCR